MEELNYEQDVNIDETALDVEWLQQPNLMWKYSSYAAIARREMDEAKERLDTGKARMEMDIRKNPQNYELDKVTESAIQSTILLQDEYKELNQEYLDARYEYDIASAVVRAIDQKKSALENLVKLLGVSYFAGPQSPHDITQEKLKWSEKNVKQKETNKRVRINKKKAEDTI